MASLFICAKNQLSQKRNRTRKYFSFLLGLFSLGILSTFLFSHPAFADYIDITKDKIQKAAVYDSLYPNNPAGAPTQGGVITKKYYVFTDCKGNTAYNSCSNGYVRVYRRDNCALVKKFNTSMGTVRGVSYEWGKEQVSIIGKHNNGGITGCVDVKGTPKFSTSGCPMPPSLTFDAGGSSQGAGTPYKGYVYKVAGLADDGYSYIKVAGKEKEKQYRISNKAISEKTGLTAKYGFEPEGISIDGSTGEVYTIHAYRVKGGHRRILFLKIDSSVFKEFTGKSGSSDYPFCNNEKSSGGSSSSSSSSDDIFTNKPYNPEDDNLTIIDDTYPTDPPVSTYDGTVDTNFFGTVKDEEGCGVYTTLSFIIDILSIGIGIAAVIGITLSGITYINSKGNVEKTTKAKRRIYEIVIGLVAYAVIYFLLTFLTPEFNPELKVCKALSAEEIAQIKAETEAKKQAIKDAQEQDAADRIKKGNYDPSNSSLSSDYATIKGADLEGATETGKLVLQAAEWSARYMDEHKFIYFQYDPGNHYYNKYIKPGYGPKGGVWEDIWPRNWEQAKEWRMTHCSGFAVLVLKKTGLFNGHRVKVYSQKGKITSYFWTDKESEAIFNKHFVKRNGNGETISSLVKQKKLGPGDIFGTSSTKETHTMIYAGKYNGKHYIYEVSAPNNHVLTYGFGKTHHYSGYLHPVISGSTHVGEFFHAK